jgi:hypothetical protein
MHAIEKKRRRKKDERALIDANLLGQRLPNSHHFLMP